MTRQGASIVKWLRSKVGRPPVSPAVSAQPPGRQSAVVRAIGAAFRAPFSRAPARPERKRPQFEALEPRVLLSAEVPVIPPQPLGTDEAVLSAPLDFSAAANGGKLLSASLLQGQAGVAAPLPELAAQQAQVVKFQDDWGAAALRNLADGTGLVLDFTAVSRNLQATVHANGSVHVTDGANEVTAERVVKLIGGAGNDTFRFEAIPRSGIAIETGGRGNDTLDLSAITADLTFTTRVDGSLEVADDSAGIVVDSAVAALPGQGNNTFVEEKAPVIAGTLLDGVFSDAAARFSLAAYAATHAAPSQIVIIDPSVANYESLLKSILAAPQPQPQPAATAGSAQAGAAAAADPQDLKLPELTTAGATPAPQQGGGSVSSGRNGEALVIVLDAHWDGMEQISQILAAYQGLAAVQILSHGSSGTLRLGNANVNTARLNAMTDKLRGWGSALVPGGDLLLYGCNVAEGEAGMEFVEDLAALTGIDVGASTNATGAAALGGDWTLEFSTGVIDTASVFALSSLEGYEHILGTTITGTAGQNTFLMTASTITPPNRASIDIVADTYTFQGGTNADTFTISALGTLATGITVTGGGGADTLDLAQVERNEVLFQKQLISAQDKDEMETEVRLREQELKRDLENLKLRTIVSPLDGVVVERKLSRGDLVRTDRSVVFKLAQIDPLNVEVVAPSEFFGSAKVGMTGNVTLRPQLPGTFKAKVVVVDRLVDAASGTFGIRLEMPNPGNRIPAGIKCSVQLAR